jgi:hypothetical protein
LSLSKVQALNQRKTLSHATSPLHPSQPANATARFTLA